MEIKASRGLPSRDASPGEPVGLDIELFGADEDRLHRPDNGTFASLGIAMGDEVWLVEDQHDVDEALRRIKHGMWVIHQATFDLMHLRRWSNVSPTRVWDTMMVEQDLFGGWYDRFSLHDLGRRWLMAYVDKSVRDRFIEGDVLDDQMRTYATWDPVITLKVQQKQAEYVAANVADFRWYWDIDEPMIQAVLDMPGVRIDVSRWGELYANQKIEFDGLRESLPFNPRSQKQVLEHFQTLGIRARDTQRTTLDKLLEKYPKHREVITAIIEAREAGVLVSTYGENWLRHLEGEYVYPHWKIVGPETGRTACADPNMQNVPIRKNPEYREAVIASEGCLMVVSDVNQQEIRGTAFFSQDDLLIKMLTRGDDTHLMVARIVFQDDTIQKGDPRRRVGKNVNLGMSYGLTASGLARDTGLGKKESASVITRYYEAFPGVKRSQDRFKVQAATNMFVRTASGRPVWINPYSDQWETNAVNSPIQGTGGDQLKLAVRLIREKAKEKGLPFGVCLMVHDEIVADVPKECVGEYSKITEESWIDAADYLMPKMPMVIDIAVGDNWGAKK